MECGRPTKNNDRHTLREADEIDPICCIGNDWSNYFLNTVYLIPHIH